MNSVSEPKRFLPRPEQLMGAEHVPHTPPDIVAAAEDLLKNTTCEGKTTRVYTQKLEALRQALAELEKE